jgi:hypothetical protein
VAPPGKQPPVKHVPADLKEDHRRGGPSVEQFGPVSAPERGAGDHRRLPFSDPGVDPLGDRAQPRPAVLVGERDALPHLGDVGFRVERVGVGEAPAQPPGEHRAHGGLTASGHAGDD